MKRKSLIKLILLLGTIVSLYFVPWPIVFAWMKPLPDTVQEQVDLAANYGFDGIVVCINKKGNELSYYTRYKNREQKNPADPNALFKIASVGKLFNALSVAKLVASGTLDLDKSLEHYLPELKGRIENSDQITLRMLVMHRSGIPILPTSQSIGWHRKKLQRKT
ncbi:MAG: serine hydrolase domain-containing protein [Flavobacteriales bacterium]